MATAIKDTYRLSRDMAGSTRLNANHMVWTMHNGWTMSPSIPMSPDMKIAEIGTGTSIWLMDLASRLPKTVTLDGFDISDHQFPHPSLLPPNMTLRTLNAFEPVPEHFVGQYDVVHLRLWTLVIKGNDPSQVIEHATALLKPGGHIQWEDAMLDTTNAVGTDAQTFMELCGRVLKSLNYDNTWLINLPDHAKKGGLEVQDFYLGPIRPVALPLATTSYVGAMDELFGSFYTCPHDDDSLPSGAECQRLLVNALEEFKRGEAQFTPRAVTMLARKPLKASD